MSPQDDLTPPRGRPPVRRPAPRRRITLKVALVLCAVAFLIGIVFGYQGRGGPGDVEMVTTNQEIPVVTVLQAPPP